MEKQTETSVQLAQDQVDFDLRALLDVEILSIGGGEAAVCLS